jgi:hypothetical protein
MSEDKGKREWVPAELGERLRAQRVRLDELRGRL